MKKYIDDFSVVSNKRLTHDFVVLTLKYSGDNLPEMLPGQFVEVKVAKGPNTYLRRPLSIHDVDYEKNHMMLLVQEIGEGTQLLAKLKAGDHLNMIYPLGNSFSLPETKNVLLVGGGCGVAPLLFMGRHLKKHGITPRFLIGARSAAHLIETDAYEELGDVYITTEDGSVGQKGFVIHHPVMKTDTPDFDMIYTCGPEPMMKVLAKYAKNRNINCEVSLENKMACGFGACLTCVVDTVDGHKCTCTDGPVYDSKLLKW